MAFLAGYLNPTPDIPAFLIPIFVERYGSNQVCIQTILPNDVVGSFVEFDVGDNFKALDCSDFGREIKIGENALWAFQLSHSRIVSGTSAEIAAHLIEALRQREFNGKGIAGK